MDNDDAIVGRIFSRREALRTVAWAGAAAMFAGVGSRLVRGGTPATTQPRLPLVASPMLTEGPFFVDEKLNRSDLVGDTTRASVVDGLPLLLSLTLYTLKNDAYAPLSGAQVDVWHADAVGAYSDESHPMNHENTAGQTWLRGYQVTDAEGLASFRTIFPGWYPGRTPHIHFKVRQALPNGKSTAEFTSQLFFQEADIDHIYANAPYTTNRRRNTRNANDMVYNERQMDGSVAGSYMLLDLRPDTDGPGYTTQFPLILTDGNLRTGGPRRREGGSGGPGGPLPDGRGGPPGRR